MSLKSFVRDYALKEYTFEGEPEEYFIARLINKHVKGKRVLNLGCGPVEPIISVFYPEANEVVAVDILKENLDFMKNRLREYGPNIERALAYKQRYLSNRTSSPRIRYMQGNFCKNLSLGKFDSVMQIGAFGAVDTIEEFQQAVDCAYSYLKPRGKLLMVNWVGGVERPYGFNGDVDEIQAYKLCLPRAGFKIKELHVSKAKVGKITRARGYHSIIWVIAEK